MGSRAASPRIFAPSADRPATLQAREPRLYPREPLNSNYLLGLRARARITQLRNFIFRLPRAGDRSSALLRNPLPRPGPPGKRTPSPATESRIDSAIAFPPRVVSPFRDDDSRKIRRRGVGAAGSTIVPRAAMIDSRIVCARGTSVVRSDRFRGDCSLAEFSDSRGLVPDTGHFSFPSANSAADTAAEESEAFVAVHPDCFAIWRQGRRYGTRHRGVPLLARSAATFAPPNDYCRKSAPIDHPTPLSRTRVSNQATLRLVTPVS